MATHFECLGFSFDDSATFEQVTIDLLSRGNVIPRQDGGEMLSWTDPSGARLVGNSNERNELDCVIPTLVVPPRLRVRPTGWLEDPTCPFCDSLYFEVVDADGGMCYPLAMQVDDIGISRSRLSLGTVHHAALTGFAESVELWDDEEAFKAGGTGNVPLGTESLIPVGLFTSEGEPATAHALITGRVVECETRTNTTTRAPFMWALVKTFGGDYDIVLPFAEVGDGLGPGRIIQGRFWLVGHVDGGETSRVGRGRGLRGLLGR